MNFLHRSIEPELLEMSKSYPVVTVIGPRQSGKTTLVRAFFPGKPYVSLENEDERTIAENDPRRFLAKYPNGAIFDEIQRAPILLSYIQGIVDEVRLNGMFILTGSHQLRLHESITQSLAGRTAILKLLPLSLSELQKNNATLALDDQILHGMYPRIFKEKINPTKYYRDYVQTYVERDVRQIINVKDLKTFQHFLKLCAGRIGQVFNSHNLSNELGISHSTVLNWLSVLEASFLIFRLQPYYENLGKRTIKAPKLYFTDVGLAAYLLDISSAEQVSRDPLRGCLVENMVVLECVKHQLNQGKDPSLYYYRDSNQHEVDLIYKAGHALVPIEIKSSMTFNSEFLKGLVYFQNVAPARVSNGFLVYAGQQEQAIKGFNVINYHNVHQIFEEQTPSLFQDD